MDEIKNKVDLKDAMLSLVTNQRTSAGTCEEKKKCVGEFYVKRMESTLLQYEAECCANNYFFGYLTVFDFAIYEIINHFKHIFSN